MAGSAVIYLGGAPGPQVVPPIDDAAVAIAADSGLGVAYELGHTVDLLVGDLDSVLADDLERATSTGLEIERHDPDKDDTDLEIAIARAVGLGVTRMTIIGGAGGRLDHLVANLAVLCGPALANVEVDAYLGCSRVQVVRDRREIVGRPAMLVSLLAWGGPARGVTTDGLRWPLRDATIEPGDAVGTSNALIDTHGAVSLSSGVLSAICPDVGSLFPIQEVLR